jgi:hypothetical protein
MKNADRLTADLNPPVSLFVKGRLNTRKSGNIDQITGEAPSGVEGFPL